LCRSTRSCATPAATARKAYPPVAVPAGREIDVVGVGQNTVDHLCVVDRFPAPDSKQRLQALAVEPGGQIATALVALRRWGARCAYLGAFGDDEAGAASRASLAEEGIDVAHAPVRRGERNQLSVILVDARNGERTVLWHRQPARVLAPEEVPRALIGRARVLHVDGADGEAAIVAAAAARAAGVVTVADVDMAFPGLDRLLALVDVLIVSWEFARTWTAAPSPDAAIATLARHGSAIVGVTLGAHGALVGTGADIVRVAGHAVDAVDTTGAGDLFHAGFIWALLTGLDVDAALRLANAAAALQCTRLGGRHAIPTLAEARALARV
jgi:sulfofructose kinase